MLYTIGPSFSVDLSMATVLVPVDLSATEVRVRVDDPVPGEAVCDGIAISEGIAVVDEIGVVVGDPCTVCLSRPLPATACTFLAPDEVPDIPAMLSLAFLLEQVSTPVMMAHILRLRALVFSVYLRFNDSKLASHIQGDPSSQRLHFVDFVLVVMMTAFFCLGFLLACRQHGITTNHSQQNIVSDLMGHCIYIFSGFFKLPHANAFGSLKNP